MDKIRVDGSNGIRFTPLRSKGRFTSRNGSPSIESLVGSTSETCMRLPKSGINPHKAVFTIDSKTSKILIANNNACQLLGYTPKELCELLFTNLLTHKNRDHVSALAEGQLNSDDGTMVLLSGKVVEMNNKFGTKVAVSLWIRQIDSEGRCLAVAEPVQRRVAQIIIDCNGFIVSTDYEARLLFQLNCDKCNGMHITSLIPAIQIPGHENSIFLKQIRKQKATGKTSDGISFPLCLMIANKENSNDLNESNVVNSSNNLFVINIWVFQNLSGLIVIDNNGYVESCNHHFSMLMFGFAQNQILGLHITALIPNFGQDIDYLGYNRSRDATNSSLNNDESGTDTDPVYILDVTQTLSNESNKNKSKQMSDSESVKNYTSKTSEATSSKKTMDDLSWSNTTESSHIEPKLDLQEHKVSVFSKSRSDHILITENRENNQNLTNTISEHSNIRHQNHIHLDDDPQSMSEIIENDLLTPVNENDMQNYLSHNENSAFPFSNSVNCQLYDLRDVSERNEDISSELKVSKESAIHSLITSSKDIDKSNNDYNSKIVTSTPDIRKTFDKNKQGSNFSQQSIEYIDGKYKGDAIHLDGNVIDILYTISHQLLPCGSRVYCVWICFDPNADYVTEDESKNQNLTLTFNSINSTVDNSLGQAIKHTAAQNSSLHNSVSLMSQCEEDQINGEFSKQYTTLKQIGKGAYGYVKMAYRNSDRLLVVTKFILKEKLTPHFMVVTEDKREIPMEIYLLSIVKHPNVVSVIDVFENENFFQLVMEKHGSGMDLFEFIDRRPKMDETLCCYIFRQIVHAVDYLHSLNILHRDIKDENIIIDQNFHVKLIDFGSATFMEVGKLFTTFYGTTEYCSPEVLSGNKYAGPELEIWSLGVTLYVLMFFENPFLDIEETLRSSLTMPYKIDVLLERLLVSMLDKNPRTRCTMKQLTTNQWINQDINTTMLNFAWIVPCESYESNPEKYYSGTMYSSTTALSTHDSISLADEDYATDCNEYVEEVDKSSQPQKDQKCDFCDEDEKKKQCCGLIHLNKRVDALNLKERNFFEYTSVSKLSKNYDNKSSLTMLSTTTEKSKKLPFRQYKNMFRSNTICTYSDPSFEALLQNVPDNFKVPRESLSKFLIDFKANQLASNANMRQFKEIKSCNKCNGISKNLKPDPLVAKLTTSFSDSRINSKKNKKIFVFKSQQNLQDSEYFLPFSSKYDITSKSSIIKGSNFLSKSVNDINFFYTNSTSIM